MERAELTAVEQCGCVSSAHASGSQPSDSPPNPALHYAQFAAHVPRRFLPLREGREDRLPYTGSSVTSLPAIRVTCTRTANYVMSVKSYFIQNIALWLRLLHTFP